VGRRHGGRRAARTSTDEGGRGDGGVGGEGDPQEAQPTVRVQPGPPQRTGDTASSAAAWGGGGAAPLPPPAQIKRRRDPHGQTAGAAGARGGARRRGRRRRGARRGPRGRPAAGARAGCRVMATTRRRDDMGGWGPQPPPPSRPRVVPVGAHPARAQPLRGGARHGPAGIITMIVWPLPREGGPLKPRGVRATNHSVVTWLLLPAPLYARMRGTRCLIGP